MLEQEIERKIEDFRSLGLPKVILRQGRLHLVENMVSTVIGARRAGKSFRVLQEADEMLRRGFIGSLDQVCYLDFDNPILAGMDGTQLSLIQHTFLKLSPQFQITTPLLFVLDEVHKIPGWENYVIDLSRNPHWKVVVTGSSSKLLRQDLATELRGKAVSTTVYPLNFSEFLRFNQFSERPGSTKGQAEQRRLFDQYLNWGAYPALTRLDEYTKEAVLHEYFDTMILKDIIQRYNVSKPKECIHLYRYLLANMSKPHTLQSAFRYLKQIGSTISRDMVRDFIDWAIDSWLLFSVPVYSDSPKEQERNYKKIYAIDWALAIRNSLSWDGSLSQAFENMVFLHLNRNRFRVQYYLTRKKRQEVDFVTVDHGGFPDQAIQVCMDIGDAETLQRELAPLISTARYFGTKENLIVTYNQEQTFNESGIRIHAVPAWKWLVTE